jgi:alcohol dehydrogenase
MRTIALQNPKNLVFGNDSMSNFIKDYLHIGYKKLFVVAAPQILPLIEILLNKLKDSDVEVYIYDAIESEPTISMFEDVLIVARNFGTDSVVGIGGGSVLDMAKLIAAQVKNSQSIKEIFGIGNLKNRATYLSCLPTTSGTGSEVSPNAILLDESDNLKKGIVSPHLVPDSSYIDPMLTVSVPPKVTAATGLDALTHCIEAYTSKYAHPIIDIFAIKGIELIASNLESAYMDGNNLEAREALSLGSLYGGFCLGPVNTAAVHALSYPLGGEFHVAHGLSNAVLLPYVMKFDIEAAPEKYADVAIALGAKRGKTAFETAMNGVDRIFKLFEKLDVPLKLSALGIPKSAIERMAEGAVKVTRLLVNNPRELTLTDARNIYLDAY